ncbi:aminoglycoside N3-acetyltransferase [Listeria floridensis FSL S10-1187]|uniref:Aminoglycoside N(3)-acetyltransferase n=1 Tax=Listeria floridensis FSL S10-1187 TaxID=1265817 RepID=A0ABP3AWA6_9LIST|nr:AAC(3) family N-acetyltransferase [Listeria floridensis]EUJ29148.1 aminoglycoside N3-acetyltransferase [Listeria floridensis FSL S10-1187]
MSEKASIHRSTMPYTVTRLQAEFAAVGIEKGDSIIFHASLSQAGWVCGGAIAVIDALQSLLTEEGTLVMPAQTAGLSDPKDWENPPVPEEWWDTIQAETPVYDKDRTPSANMGVIAETFRALKDVKRSEHPYYSFTAWGKHADWILEGQTLEHGFGKNSPLGKLYEIEASKIILFGVDNDKNTSLHLAEELSSKIPLKTANAAVIENGKRVRKYYQEKAYDSDQFIKVGEAYEKTHGDHKQTIALAPSKVYKMKEIVDFAASYFDR